MKTFRKIIKAIGNSLVTFGGIIALLIAIAVWVIIVNFVYDHQWIVLPMDVFVVILFAFAMKKTVLSGRLNMDKDKLFMLIFIFSTALLILSSFGALWNFLIMMFLFPIFMVIQMNLIQRRRSG